MIYNPLYTPHHIHFLLHYHIPLFILVSHFNMNLDTLTNLADNLNMSLTYHSDYFHTLVYTLLNPSHNSYNSPLYLHFHLHTSAPVYIYLTYLLDMFHNPLIHPVPYSNISFYIYIMLYNLFNPFHYNPHNHSLLHLLLFHFNTSDSFAPYNPYYR